MAEKEVRISCKGSHEVNLSEITPIQKDLKDLSEKNYQKLRNEILNEGFVAPFMLWDDKIVDGTQRHRTLNKMKAEGIKMPDKFPAVEVHAGTETHARRLILALSSNYGEMTDDGLFEFLSDSHIGFDEMDARFEFDAINFSDFKDEFYTDPEVDNPKEDEVPEVGDSISKLGDVWELGEHKILCGDCTVEENLKLLMGGEKADMVFTDPPYGIGLDTAYAKTEKVKGNTYKKIIGDDKDFDPTMFLNFFENTKEQFWWGFDYYSDKLPKGGSLVVWDKKKEGLDESIGSGFELCWSKVHHKRLIARFLWSGFTAKEKNETRVHPTQKPIALIEWFINNWGEGLVNIVDPFLGSGSTLIACEKTNRKCYGMELDPHYIDVIVQRYIDFTNNPDSVYLIRDGKKRSYKDTK